MQGDYLGLVLAGGQSRRMGRDKALLPFGEGVLFEHVLCRFAQQIDTILVSTASDHPAFVHCGRELVGDLAPFKQLGPLSGLFAALHYCQNLKKPLSYKGIITIAVDTPFFPDDYVARLCDAASSKPKTPLIAATSERSHPTFALWPMAVASILRQHLEKGQYSLLSFAVQQGAENVIFTDEAAFFNINRQQEWVLAQHKRTMLEQFPKSMKRFSDENCGKNKRLEHSVKPSETKML